MSNAAGVGIAMASGRIRNGTRVGLQGRPDIEKFGVAKFNEACRGL